MNGLLNDPTYYEVSKRIVVRFFVVIVLSTVLLAQAAHAADSYQVASGATVDITEFGVCKRVTNNHASGAGIFVPTRTAVEWSSFYGGLPPGVTATACPTSCAGATVGGHCWYRAAVGQSCDAACSSHGGVVLAGIRDYAGSSGTLANCQAVFQGLGISGTAVTSTDPAFGALGCAVRTSFPPGNWRQAAPATTSAASSVAFARLCSCVQ